MFCKKLDQELQSKTEICDFCNEKEECMCENIVVESKDSTENPNDVNSELMQRDEEVRSQDEIGEKMSGEYEKNVQGDASFAGDLANGETVETQITAEEVTDATGNFRNTEEGLGIMENAEANAETGALETVGEADFAVESAAAAASQVEGEPTVEEGITAEETPPIGEALPPEVGSAVTEGLISEDAPSADGLSEAAAAVSNTAEEESLSDAHSWPEVPEDVQKYSTEVGWTNNIDNEWLSSESSSTQAGDGDSPSNGWMMGNLETIVQNAEKTESDAGGDSLEPELPQVAEHTELGGFAETGDSPEETESAEDCSETTGGEMPYELQPENNPWETEEKPDDVFAVGAESGETQNPESAAEEIFAAEPVAEGIFAAEPAAEGIFAAEPAAEGGSTYLQQSGEDIIGGEFPNVSGRAGFMSQGFGTAVIPEIEREKPQSGEAEAVTQSAADEEELITAGDAQATAGTDEATDVPDWLKAISESAEGVEETVSPGTDTAPGAVGSAGEDGDFNNFMNMFFAGVADMKNAKEPEMQGQMSFDTSVQGETEMTKGEAPSLAVTERIVDVDVNDFDDFAQKMLSEIERDSQITESEGQVVPQKQANEQAAVPQTLAGSNADDSEKWTDDIINDFNKANDMTENDESHIRYESRSVSTDHIAEALDKIDPMSGGIEKMVDNVTRSDLAAFDDSVEIGGAGTVAAGGATEHIDFAAVSGAEAGLSTPQRAELQSAVFDNFEAELADEMSKLSLMMNSLDMNFGEGLQQPAAPAAPPSAMSMPPTGAVPPYAGAKLQGFPPAPMADINPAAPMAQAAPEVPLAPGIPEIQAFPPPPMATTNPILPEIQAFPPLPTAPDMQVFPQMSTTPIPTIPTIPTIPPLEAISPAVPPLEAISPAVPPLEAISPAVPLMEAISPVIPPIAEAQVAQTGAAAQSSFPVFQQALEFKDGISPDGSIAIGAEPAIFVPEPAPVMGIEMPVFQAGQSEQGQFGMTEAAGFGKAEDFAALMGLAADSAVPEINAFESVKSVEVPAMPESNSFEELFKSIEDERTLKSVASAGQVGFGIDTAASEAPTENKASIPEDFAINTGFSAFDRSPILQDIMVKDDEGVDWEKFANKPSQVASQAPLPEFDFGNTGADVQIGTASDVPVTTEKTSDPSVDLFGFLGLDETAETPQVSAPIDKSAPESAAQPVENAAAETAQSAEDTVEKHLKIEVDDFRFNDAATMSALGGDMFNSWDMLDNLVGLNINDKNVDAEAGEGAASPDDGVAETKAEPSKGAAESAYSDLLNSEDGEIKPLTAADAEGQSAEGVTDGGADGIDKSTIRIDLGLGSDQGRNVRLNEFGEKDGVITSTPVDVPLDAAVQSQGVTASQPVPSQDVQDASTGAKSGVSDIFTIDDVNAIAPSTSGAPIPSSQPQAVDAKGKKKKEGGKKSLKILLLLLILIIIIGAIIFGTVDLTPYGINNQSFREFVMSLLGLSTVVPDSSLLNGGL